MHFNVITGDIFHFLFLAESLGIKPFKEVKHFFSFECLKANFKTPNNHTSANLLINEVKRHFLNI